jgi:hypothetical protein
MEACSMTPRKILCLAGLLVAGCAASQSWTKPASWTRPNVAASEIERDTSGCLAVATSSPVVNSKGRVIAAGLVSKDQFVACMRLRGYEPNGKGGSEPPPHGSRRTG